jgi:tryptophan halogenase
MHESDTVGLRVVIAGGGTAGWMAAAALSRLVASPIQVSLIESEQIGTVGVGEATIPTLLTINRLLQIPEPDFVKATKATFKLGIQFENWQKVGDSYIHSFGDTGSNCWAGGFQHFWLRAHRLGLAKRYGDYCPELVAAEAGRFGQSSTEPLNYAYHLDSTLYGQYLRSLAESAGVHRIEGIISKVELHPDSGNIHSVHLDDGRSVAGDLFIDCTGFKALLIEGALKSGFDNWSSWLPADRALAVQTASIRAPVPYTRAIAHEAGWRWQIPLQHRVGNGLVYSSHYLGQEDANKLFSELIEGPMLTEPRPIRFTTGQRKRYWTKNCIALGLSSGFIEPLESTSIHMIQNGIMWLLLMFPERGIHSSIVDEYNAKMRLEAEHIRDFIVLHYHLNERFGDPFWDYLRHMEIPDSLQQRIALFRDSARVFKPQDDVFSENSWVQVMLGQGVMPQGYHNIADALSADQLTSLLREQSNKAQAIVNKLPPHGAYVEALVKHASQPTLNT